MEGITVNDGQVMRDAGGTWGNFTGGSFYNFNHDSPFVVSFEIATQYARWFVGVERERGSTSPYFKLSQHYLAYRVARKPHVGRNRPRRIARAAIGVVTRFEYAAIHRA
jgi:hypothetical protein